MATIAREHRAVRAHVGSEVGAFLRHLDYLLIAAVGGVIAYGIWVLAAVTRNDVPGDASYYVSRQEIYIAVGAILAAVVTAISPDAYRRWAKAFYVLAVALLLLVLVVGDDVRGSKRWIEFGSFPIEIAGKTGTAEKFVRLPGYQGLQDQAWWCGYGPYGKPKLVVCALIENGGHGGTAAAPAALEVFQQYFHVESQYSLPGSSD